MSHTKIGPTLTVVENEKHEMHSFWFENFKCSVKVDRSKDGQSLAITLKSPDGKVVVSLGPDQRPRFVTQVRYMKSWTNACDYTSEIGPKGVKLQFHYEPT